MGREKVPPFSTCIDDEMFVSAQGPPISGRLLRNFKATIADSPPPFSPRCSPSLPPTPDPRFVGNLRISDPGYINFSSIGASVFSAPLDSQHTYYYKHLTSKFSACRDNTGCPLEPSFQEQRPWFFNSRPLPFCSLAQEACIWRKNYTGTRKSISKAAI